MGRVDDLNTFVWEREMRMKKIYFWADRCNGCRACEVVCIEKQSLTKSLFMATREQPAPQTRIYMEKFGEHYWASICQNCVEALCVGACMTGAMQYSETGEVFHNLKQCVGCWMCVMVCPFGAVVPLEEVNKAGKCNLCKDEINPPCVVACTQKALCYCTPEEYEMKVAGDWYAISYHRE